MTRDYSWDAEAKSTYRFGANDVISELTFAQNQIIHQRRAMIAGRITPAEYRKRRNAQMIIICRAAHELRAQEYYIARIKLHGENYVTR